MSLPPPIPPPKRPVWVWIISGFHFVSFVFTGFSFWLVFSGIIPLPEAQRTYFSSLTWVDYGCTIAIALCNLTGALLLLLLRRATVSVFTLGLGISLAFTVYQIVAKNWLKAMGSGLPGPIFGWAVAVGIILYARNLAKNGVLR